MAFGNWDSVLDEYREFHLGAARTSEHAEAMIELIPKIRANNSFAGLVPGTSHASLFFVMPKKTTQIRIWYENYTYLIHFYNPALDIVYHRVDADKETILPTLEKCVLQLRDEGTYE